MPLTGGTKHYNTFLKGIQTDASVINHPDGFSLDEENLTLQRDGSRKRRLGLKVEDGSSEILATGFSIQSGTYQTYRWDNVADNPGVTLHVIKLGTYVGFFLEAGDRISGAVGYLNLDANLYFDSTSPSTLNAYLDFAEVKGKLIITGTGLAPLICSYDSTRPVGIIVKKVQLRVRDFLGVDDGLGVSQKPTALGIPHQYNLQNQGWEPIYWNGYFGATGTYPSNAQIQHLGKVENGVGAADIFLAAQLDSITFGSKNSPRGSFITTNGNSNTTTAVSFKLENNGQISSITEVVANTTYRFTTVAAHNMVATDKVLISDASVSYTDTATRLTSHGVDLYLTVNAVTATTFDCSISWPDYASGWSYEGGGEWVQQIAITGDFNSKYDPALVAPTGSGACASYSGRLWLGTMENSNEVFRGTVFFSQVVQNDGDYKKFYQDGDPTAEFENELVATDGGTLVIPGMGHVLRMEEQGDSLVLWADNGIWVIGPGDSGRFQPDNFSINRIGNIVALSSKSIVEAEGDWYFWAREGIFKTTLNNVGSITIENITVNQFQNGYLGLADTPQQLFDTEGRYDDYSKVITWVHQSGQTLRYDLVLQAFSKYRFAIAEAGVTASVVGATSLRLREINGERIKYLVVNTDERFSFCDLSQGDYSDFSGFFSGASGEVLPYLLTGHEIAEAPHLHKSSNYVTVYMERSETEFVDDGSGGAIPDLESGCLMYLRWEWTDSVAAGGKWVNPIQVYRHRQLFIPATGIGDAYDNGYPVIVTKNKVRGRGRALQIRFEGELGKEMRLLGWSSTLQVISPE